MTYDFFVLFRLVSVYVLSFNAKTCMAVFHVFLLCLTILMRPCVNVWKLFGKHEAELAGARVYKERSCFLRPLFRISLPHVIIRQHRPCAA